jgi:coenzyme F420-0:L-glutamate ligase/coenzyme F420-1:gamma-L-glutamate ligase
MSDGDARRERTNGDPDRLSLIALPGLPLVAEGDDLAALIVAALGNVPMSLAAGDVVVLAQKIVSKAEGRLVSLADVTPSPRALELAGIAGKDPREVELMLSESTEVVRARPGVIVVRHRLGLVLANAGIDHSNVGPDGDEQVLLLPRDPDGTCADLRRRLREATGVEVATMIIDSLGRAWRNGTIGTAIGASGLPGLLDLRGHPDLFGRRLQTSELGFADEVAAAASLLMGQSSQGRPVVVVRGLGYDRTDGNAAELLRPAHLDLFR